MRINSAVLRWRYSRVTKWSEQEKIMDLWAQLFSDSVGIMSALVIGFMILMGGWFVWYFITHMVNDGKRRK